jgi:hypothetical protein
MLRRFVVAVVVLFVVVGIIIAAEAKGKITKTDIKDKGSTITVKVDDKDVVFAVQKAKVVDKDGKEIDGGTKKLNEGDEVTVTYEEKEKNGVKRNVASEVKVTKPK